MQTAIQTSTIQLAATVVPEPARQSVELDDCVWLEIVGSSCSTMDLLRLLLQHQSFETLAAYYVEDNGHETAPAVQRILPIGEIAACEFNERTLLAAGQSSRRSSKTEIRRLVSPDRTIVAVPVNAADRPPATLVWLIDGFPAEHSVRAATQLLTAGVLMWHYHSRLQALEAEVTDWSAIIELLEMVIASPSSKHAGYALVAALQAYLKTDVVILGLRPAGSQSCRLVAVSGIANFDEDSELVQVFESVFQETLLNDRVLTWPIKSDEVSPYSLADVCMHFGGESAQSFPLRTKDGKTLGALLLLDRQASSADANTTRFLMAAERPLATALWHCERKSLLRPRAAMRSAFAGLKSLTGRACLAIALVIAIVLMIPVPYQVHSPCRLEPVTSRFVAAPFEGTLEKTLAKPGQIVKAGEVLARIDGREIHWKRAALAADLSQATKKRDAAQVARNYAEQQIAQLEIQRLATEIELLDHRAANLEITCPVEGIITSGDLERVEGAPLQVGQTLFEIAPLDKMIVEIAVPDAEIIRIAEGKPVQVRLDAFSGQTWNSQLARIHPRAEIRDEANVFIAEAEFDNRDGRLRPGMKGRARITSDRRSLAWILFHGPWEFLLKQLTW